jgi:hypothetical protein
LIGLLHSYPPRGGDRLPEQPVAPAGRRPVIFDLIVVPAVVAARTVVEIPRATRSI